MRNNVLAKMALIFVSVSTSALVLKHECKAQNETDVVKSLTMSIRAEEAGNSDPGDPIVYITLKNVTKQTVRLPYDRYSRRSRSLTGQFKITMRDAQGNQVPYTRFGNLVYVSHRITQNGTSRSWASITLNAGGQATFKISVSRLFDISIPGTYKISVAYYPSPYSDVRGHIESNQTEINVKGPALAVVTVK